jgi:hypothetical protein
MSAGDGARKGSARKKGADAEPAPGMVLGHFVLGAGTVLGAVGAGGLTAAGSGSVVGDEWVEGPGMGRSGSNVGPGPSALERRDNAWP